MRTLIESILDGDLNVHDEAVFTDQIIPEIVAKLPYNRSSLADKLSIKVENGRRILIVSEKKMACCIFIPVVQLLKKYNIYEIRSDGYLVFNGSLTGFTISASHIRFITDKNENLVYTKCDITCDTLVVAGPTEPQVKCKQCRIKAKNYDIRRDPIEFVNSKIIGLNSIHVFWDTPSTRTQLSGLGLKYSASSGIAIPHDFEEAVSDFDPLKSLTGMQKITKLPNIFVYLYRHVRTSNSKPKLMFKSPSIPIAKATAISMDPIDCANGYRVLFLDRVSIS